MKKLLALSCMAVVMLIAATSAFAADYIICESDGDSFERCPVRTDRDLRDLDVRLVERLSHSACLEGRTWGVDRHSVWVDRGCRARFAVESDRRYEVHSRKFRVDWDRDDRYTRHNRYDHYDRHSRYDSYYRPHRTEREMRYEYDRSSW